MLAHYSQAVKGWLDEQFPQQWIGRQWSVEWPPQFPDLTLLTFTCGAIWKPRSTLWGTKCWVSSRVNCLCMQCDHTKKNSCRSVGLAKIFVHLCQCEWLTYWANFVTAVSKLQYCLWFPTQRTFCRRYNIKTWEVYIKYN